MSIIVEGPDGAGKSTLAESLGSATGLPVIHGGGPPKTETEARNRAREPLINQAVYDRNVVVSEQVYGALRKGWILLETEIDALVINMIHSNVAFIYCRPKDPFLTVKLKENLKIKKPWKSDQHCADVEANYKLVLSLYDQVFNKIRSMGAVILSYDWTEGRIPCAE